jgi:hypothetical protein
MTSFITNFIFVLLIASCLQTATIAGPVAYAACMTACMGASGFVLTAACAVMCAPLLVAPTP